MPITARPVKFLPPLPRPTPPPTPPPAPPPKPLDEAESAPSMARFMSGISGRAIWAEALLEVILLALLVRLLGVLGFCLALVATARSPPPPPPAPVAKAFGSLFWITATETTQAVARKSRPAWISNETIRPWPPNFSQRRAQADIPALTLRGSGSGAGVAAAGTSSTGGGGGGADGERGRRRGGWGGVKSTGRMKGLYHPRPNGKVKRPGSDFVRNSERV